MSGVRNHWFKDAVISAGLSIHCFNFVVLPKVHSSVGKFLKKPWKNMGKLYFDLEIGFLNRANASKNAVQCPQFFAVILDFAGIFAKIFR